MSVGGPALLRAFAQPGTTVMSAKSLSLIAALALILSTAVSLAQGQQPAALTGVVSSAQEPSMEGVVVSAKKAGGTVTISVATDQTGRYSFPAARLEPGQYALSIRAVGYELDGPKAAEVKAGQATHADVKLRPT